MTVVSVSFDHMRYECIIKLVPLMMRARGFPENGNKLQEDDFIEDEGLEREEEEMPVERAQGKEAFASAGLFIFFPFSPREKNTTEFDFAP